MLAGTLNSNHRIVALYTHMAESSERKWRTLRKIAPSQGELPAAGAVGGTSLPSRPPATSSESTGTSAASGARRVPILVAHPVASTSRLIRETLEQFTEAQVHSTSDPLRAFELALQRPYGLFFFAWQVGELSGPMLYELISKAWTAGRGPRSLAPGVIFVREKEDPKVPEALVRDVRVRDILTKPVRIERLLESVRGVVEVRDPTARG